MSSVIRKLKDVVSGETSTVDRADADMQDVLNELTALNGFFGMAAVVKKARDAQEFAGRQLKKSFNSLG